MKRYLYCILGVGMAMTPGCKQGRIHRTVSALSTANTPASVKPRLPAKSGRSNTTGTSAKVPNFVDMATMARTAPIIVVARVEDPRNKVVNIPVTDPKGRPAEPYQRLIRLFTLVRTLRGQVPQHIRVDEANWQALLTAYRTCKHTGRCEKVAVPRYKSELAREPLPGQEVILFLRRNTDNELELAADLAIDSADRLSELEAKLNTLAPKAPKGPTKPALGVKP